MTVDEWFVGGVWYPVNIGDCHNTWRKTRLTNQWNDWECWTLLITQLDENLPFYFPPTECSRAHTLLNVHSVLFFTVFSASLQCCPGGGRGGRNNWCNWWSKGGDVSVPCNLLTLLMLRHAGVGGMLAFHVTCSHCWCYATLGWGDVNVPCNLLTLLMLRHAGVGGMLAFHVTCSRCWCYATLGWGGC